MNRFSYLRPATLEEALDLLAQYGHKAVPVAGGTDVIINAKRRRLEADTLISLRRLTDLDYIKADARRLLIGGLTTLRSLEKSRLTSDRLPALADAVRNMASIQIRNVATMSGNIVNAAPSADTAPPLLVSEAEVRLTSTSGERIAPLSRFFLSPGRTVLEPGEILTEFIIPQPPEPFGQAYWKHSRRQAMDLALVSAAVHLELEDDLETCRRARIALGVAGPTPLRTPEAEARLAGRKITAEVLDDVGRVACGESLCRDSLRGQAWYRQEIIRVMVRRMGRLAFERARAKAAGARG